MILDAMKSICGRSLVSGLSMAWAVMCCAGCGSSDYPVAEVSGTVTFEGNPMVGGGQIMFVPLAEDGKASTGEILPDGTFKLTTYEAGDGAIVGEHRVEVWQETVLKHAVKEYERSEKGEKERLISPEERIPEKDVIPSVYSGRSSPLRVTVSEDASELEIVLSRNP